MGDQYQLNHCFKQICVSGYHDRYFGETAHRTHFRGPHRERVSWYYTDSTHTAKKGCPNTVSGVCVCYVVINLFLVIF